MVLMDLTGIFLCILTMYLTCKPAWAYSLVQVPDCPSSKPDWDKHANNYKANCTNGITYHCLLSVQGELHEGCMRYILINATAKGDCPQVRGVSGDFAFEGGNFNCTEDATVCPKIGSSYRSDELYKYPGCFGNRSVIQTTEKTTEKATEQILKDTTYSTTNIPESGLSTVAKFGIVFGVTVLITGILIGLGIIGCFVWRGRTGRIRNQTSASGKPSNGAAQYSVVSQSEPPIMSNGSPLSVEESNGGTNHTLNPQSEPQTRPGHHTRVPQAEPNNRSNGCPHSVDGLPEADGGEEDDVQQDTQFQSMGTNESAGKGGNNITYNNCNFIIKQTNKIENPAAVQFGSDNTANICSESTDNRV